MLDWFTAPADALLGVALSTVAIFATLLVIVRVVGLRSFSKMTGFDFAVTIAIGSVLAATLLTPDPPVAQGAVAIGLLFGLQVIISLLRSRSPGFARLVDNPPLFLMLDGRVLDDNLKRARVSVSDLQAKLREANVLDPCEVRAVVFEATGDISVLHGDPDGRPLDPWLVDGVGGGEIAGAR